MVRTTKVGEFKCLQISVINTRGPLLFRCRWLYYPLRITSQMKQHVSPGHVSSLTICKCQISRMFKETKVEL